MTILITGTSTGIGKTTAQTLLAAGHTVFGTARKEADHLELNKHPNFRGLIVDVTDREAIKRALTQVQSEGHLHAVVNNAGVAITGPLENLPEEAYRHQFEVNVFGVLAVCQEALPLLHAANEAGETNLKIINISSVSGYISSPFTSIYSASKFALEAITDGMRRELMPYNIDVISIAPGPVKTPIWAKANNQKENYVGSRYEYLVEGIGKYAQAANDSGLEPQVIADLIHKALNDKKPRTNHLVMNKRWMAKLLMKLPKRRADKLLRNNVDRSKRY